jgi:hypothetical protein
MEQPVEFTIRVDTPDHDAEESDQLARELLRDLRDQPVDSAELVANGPAPAGTKGGLAAMGIEIAVVVGPHLVKLIVEMISKRLHGSGTIRFEGKLGGSPVKFEGKAEEFARLLGTLTSASARAR